MVAELMEMTQKTTRHAVNRKVDVPIPCNFDCRDVRRAPVGYRKRCLTNLCEREDYNCDCRPVPWRPTWYARKADKIREGIRTLGATRMAVIPVRPLRRARTRWCRERRVWPDRRTSSMTQVITPVRYAQSL
jgi:hypothetical protein